MIDKIDLLDKGFVRLVDHMGDDLRIVQAARVSYGKGTKTLRQDGGLIRYLLRNQHTSPFEQVDFVFHLKMPIFVARQLVRHRTASLNEISGRYSILKAEAYLPLADRLSEQSKVNKQGSGKTIIHKETVKKLLKNEQQDLFSHYTAYLDDYGLAKELARIDLPLSTYTEMYWKIDLHNLFHFLQLRLSPHAQFEIRVYAEAIFKIIKQYVPISCEAFEDFMLYSKTFSRQEMEQIKKMIDLNLCTLKGRKKEIFIEKLV